MFKPEVSSEMDIKNIDNYFLKQKVAETPENGSIILDNYESFSYQNKNSILPTENNFHSMCIEGDSKISKGNNSFERECSPLR